MFSFLLIASLMVVVALAFVLVPLLRRKSGEGVSDSAGNVAVLRAQKSEIEGEHARGMLTAAERDAALSELTARALEEVPAGDTSLEVGVSPAPRVLAVLLAIAIVTVAVSLYAAFGNRDALRGDPPPQHAADEGPTEDQIRGMVDALAKKMEQNPADPKGWVLLGRSQAALGKFPEAVQAFDRAVTLSPKDAQLLADYADSMAMIQQGRFEGKPMALVARALAIDGNNLKALALAGTGELRLGNRAASLVHWKKLQTLLPKESDDYRQVEAIIRDVTAPAGAQASAPATQPAPAAPAAPTATAAAPGAAKVEGQIALAPELASQIAAGDTLFVFARAASGPRMPLAVMKIPAPKTWPQPYMLTDAMAMTPAMKLSAFTEVIIEARISKSGNAQLQPGDLSGVSGVIKPGAAAAVPITIDRRVP
ncbi:MAG: c-type cytochrome biogenesis protein CcmI [Betaproteobacteria bacterium]|nr:c-type cytochrome biogenesis protein CcmI [Betaproteobacteria bacterium]